MRVGGDHLIPASSCLNCGKLLDAATGVLEYGFDATPDPGDLTVCIACGHLMAFGDDLQLRDLTAEEMKDAAGDRRIIAIQEARARTKHDDQH